MTFRGFIWLLIINLLVVLIYVIWNLLKKRARSRSFLIKTVVMLLCPLVGPCFFIFSYLLYGILFSAQVDLEDVIFSKERVATYMHADEERERNMVPLEEAIAITDRGNLRELMMNVVRGDIQKSLAAISLALNSEDSETSHYAASVLQDSLNDFRANVQKNYQQIQEENEAEDKEKDNDLIAEHCMILQDYMNRVLVQRVFTDMEQKSFADIMDRVTEIGFTANRNYMSSTNYENVCLRLLETEDFVNCKKWCERAAEQFPNTLSSYTCQLKLYFTSGERDEFFRVMKELRSSNVIIDNETLELIRVFM